MSEIKIHSVETGEVIEREMNAEELAQLTKDKAEAKTQVDADAKLQADKAAAKAKLKALGLTADDLKALGL